jgi:hypothetical protein
VVDITSTSIPPNNYPALVVPDVSNAFSANLLLGSVAVGVPTLIPHDGVYFWYSEGDFGSGGQLVLEQQAQLDSTVYFPITATDTPGAPPVKLMITAGTILRVHATSGTSSGVTSNIRSWID